MRRLALAVLVVGAARLALAEVPRAWAEPPAPAPATSLRESLSPDAKAEYDAAILLYENKDFAGAALKFRRAYDAAKDPRLLFNVADCEIYLHHYARAVTLLRRYLAEGGALVSESRRQTAKDVLEKVERFTTAMKIVVSEPGAEIFVDDEKVGASPLNEAVIVDIGMRKVRAKKDGYRDAVKEQPVGGAGEVSVELKLERDVHEGKVTVHASAGASITLDGKLLGAGTWQGAVPSGGHTLRVTAPGMHAYQSEITVQDGEQRTIDVALEPIPVVVAAPPKEEEWRGALGGLELGLRGGYGVVMRGDSPGVTQLWVDLGFRLGRPTFLGVYGQYGAIDASGRCGTDLHGATPSFPTDLDTRYSTQGCSYAKAGLELLIHPAPRSRFIDVWFGFDAGFQVIKVNAKVYDPLVGVTRDESANYAGIAAGAQLGVDLHPIPTYWRLAVGPFAAYSVVLLGDGFNRLNKDSNNGGSLKSISSNGHDAAPFGNLLFGLRSAVTF